MMILRPSKAGSRHSHSTRRLAGTTIVGGKSSCALALARVCGTSPDQQSGATEVRYVVASCRSASRAMIVLGEQDGRGRRLGIALNDSSRSVVVLEHLPDPSDEQGADVRNPYTKLVVESLPTTRIHVKYFSWPKAMGTQYDVLHIHWPDQLLRGKSRLGTMSCWVLATALLVRLRISRTPVVQTLHNVKPHERGRAFERWYLRQVDRLTSRWIVLNQHTPIPSGQRAVLIRHGHYRDLYPNKKCRGAMGQLLSFGQLRPYKGVEALLSAFGEVGDPSLRLTIAGLPSNSGIRNTVVHAAEIDPRVDLDLRFVPDEELVAKIRRAEIVVLPYDDLHNSGALLLALSLDRPVIVPENPITADLRQECGAAWVTTFQGQLTPEKLSSAISDLRTSVRSGSPDLSQREWPALGEALADVLEDAAQSRLIRRERGLRDSTSV